MSYVLRIIPKNNLVKKFHRDDKTTNIKFEKPNKVEKILQNKLHIDGSSIHGTTEKFEESCEGKNSEKKKVCSHSSDVKLPTECSQKKNLRKISVNENSKSTKIIKAIDESKCKKKVIENSQNTTRIKKHSDIQNNFSVNESSNESNIIIENKEINQKIINDNLKASITSETPTFSNLFLNKDTLRTDLEKSKTISKTISNNDDNILDKNDIAMDKSEFFDNINKVKSNIYSEIFDSNLTSSEKIIPFKTIEKCEVFNYLDTKSIDENVTKCIEILPNNKKATVLLNYSEQKKINEQREPYFFMKHQKYDFKNGDRMIIKQQLMACSEPNIIIKSNDRTLEVNDNIKLMLQKDENMYLITLTVEKVDLDFNGILLFTASNTSGSDESIVAITVKDKGKKRLLSKAPQINGVKEKHVKEGEKLELYYIIKSDDDLKVQILKDNLLLDDSKFNIQKKIKKYVVSIKFNKVSLFDSGEYTCKAITHNEETVLKTIIYVEKKDIQQKRETPIKEEIPRKKKSIPKALKIPNEINSLYGEPSTKISKINMTAEIEKSINSEKTIYIIQNQTKSLSTSMNVKKLNN